jgi:hypothetical protein
MIIAVFVLAGSNARLWAVNSARLPSNDNPVHRRVRPHASEREHRTVGSRLASRDRLADISSDAVLALCCGLGSTTSGEV